MKSLICIKFYNILIFLLIIYEKLNIFVKANESDVTKILNSIFEKGYDKRVRPNFGGAPVEVGVTMFILGISSVSEHQMDFTSTFYFRQIWKDKRLEFDTRNGINDLFVAEEVAQRIWVPDTFFANEKSAFIHTVPTPNSYLKISSNGQVLRSLRLTMTASCPMNFHYLPMDRQHCSLEIESYGFSAADIVYKWGSASVGLSENVELPQFKVYGIKQSTKFEKLSTGNYSRLVCELQLKRSPGYYVLQFYIPAILIVIMSWVSFWLRKSGAQRVIVGVATTLSIIGLMYSTNSILPKISYFKAIDVFLGFCFLMVFCSLLEYCTVDYLTRKIALRETHIQQMDEAVSETQRTLISGKNVKTDENEKNRIGFQKVFGLNPTHFDIVSRIVFPIVFIIFNLIYWIYYMNVSD